MISNENKELVRQFREDGYVILRGFFNADEMKTVLENVDRLVNKVIPTMPQEEVYYEEKGDPASLKQIQRLFQYDEYFSELMTRSRFRELAELLLEDEVKCHNMQYFNKPPQLSKPTPPHQDGYYFQIEPPEGLTMWFALDDADEENGSVQYVKGSNHNGMREHKQTQTLGFSQGMTDFGTDADKASTVITQAEPGDLIVHHALTIHWANKNTSSTRNRRSLGFIYFAEQTACVNAVGK